MFSSARLDSIFAQGMTCVLSSPGVLLKTKEYFRVQNHRGSTDVIQFKAVVAPSFQATPKVMQPSFNKTRTFPLECLHTNQLPGTNQIKQALRLYSGE